MAALLVSTLPARAVFVGLPGTSSETPGTTLSAAFPSEIFGNVVKDKTVSFSLAHNAYETGTASGAAVQLCFRGSTQTVPFYLINRYLAEPGTTPGPCATPVPFELTGTLRFLSVDRGGGLRDYYFQIANTTPLSAGSGHDMFRIMLEGLMFGGEAAFVAYTDSLAPLTGLTSGWVGGTVAPVTADRNVVLPGNIGFDFALQPPLPFLGLPGNIYPGDVSQFMVIRTDHLSPSPEEGEGLLAASDAEDFPDFRVVISSAGTLDVRPLADVPEPGAGLLAAAGAWVLSVARGRRR